MNYKLYKINYTAAWLGEKEAERSRRRGWNPQNNSFEERIQSCASTYQVTLEAGLSICTLYQ